MPKPGTLLGDIGEELKGLGKDFGQSVIRETKVIGKAAAQQIGIEHGEKDAAKEAGEKAPTSEINNQSNQEFLKAMYGSSEQKVENVEKVEEKNSVDESLQKELEGKTPEEQQDILRKRQELAQMHNASYYQPLTEKIEQESKTPEDSERAADRVERLGMEDLQEKREEEEKKKPIAVDRLERATEANRGTTG